MKFIHSGHSYEYNAENIARMFFKDSDDVLITTGLTKGETATEVTAELTIGSAKETDSMIVNNDEPSYDNDCKHDIAVCVYTVCSRITGKELPFGYLCGVRPAKIATDILLSGGTAEDAYRHYVNDLHLFPVKAESCVKVALAQRDALSVDYERRCNLYVSIPFCPSRCGYCSFVTHSVEKAGKLLDTYVKLLAEELSGISSLISELGLGLDAIYVGGGTPGILNEAQLAFLCKEINRRFDMGSLKEFTYEFGRADVASPRKFAILKNSGVTRVCINPQILSDEVLEANGRRHTVRQFYDAFEMARSAGFDNINCDMIAGLPYSTVELFCETAESLIKLGADDITVHTLALKKSSAYFHELDIDDNLAEKSFDAAEKLLHAAGYGEYYVYRQKRAGGNLENKGYALKGKESLYNILMMSDASTVISAGAGGITKLVSDGGAVIKRVCDYKYPYEYIDRPQKITDNLSYIKKFYSRREGE